MTTARFQDIIDSLESLSVEDQDYLFDLIRKRRVEKRHFRDQTEWGTNFTSFRKRNG